MQLADDRAGNRIQFRLLVQTVLERTVHMPSMVTINPGCLMVLLEAMHSWAHCTS